MNDPKVMRGPHVYVTGFVDAASFLVQPTYF